MFFDRPTKPMRCACGHELVSVEAAGALWDRAKAEGWSRDRFLAEIDVLFQAAPHPPPPEGPKP